MIFHEYDTKHNEWIELTPPKLAAWQTFVRKVDTFLYHTAIIDMDAQTGIINVLRKIDLYDEAAADPDSDNIFPCPERLVEFRDQLSNFINRTRVSGLIFPPNPFVCIDKDLYIYKGSFCELNCPMHLKLYGICKGVKVEITRVAGSRGAPTASTKPSQGKDAANPETRESKAPPEPK